MSFRPELSVFFTATTPAPALDFAEVHIEALLDGDPHRQDALSILRDQGIPMTLHSTELDLLAPDFMQDGRIVEQVGQLADRLDVETISTHLARSEGWVGRIRSFFRPSYTPSVLDLTLQRLEDAETKLGKPIAVENIAIYAQDAPDEIDEIAFLNAVAQACPRRLIFDISNFLTNVANGFADPETMRTLAANDVVYFHISGGRDHEEFFVDTHGDAIPEPHLNALADFRNRLPQINVLYERDIRYENRAEIANDLTAIHSVVRS